MATITIHNVTTGEIVEREMTKEELKQFELDQAAIADEIATKQAEAERKSQLLERLGITPDEAKLLLS